MSLHAPCYGRQRRSNALETIQMLETRPAIRRSTRAVLLSGLALVGCRQAVPDTPPNVVFVCLDTVRADHLGAYGYERDTTPFLDELAARGTRFADTSATASWTKPSVPSFLTGTFPSQHGVYEGSARLRMGEVTDVLPQEALTVAEVFQDRGYRTAAFVHNAQLRYGNGFEQGFDLYAQESWDAREIRWRSLDWLDELESNEQPYFLYLHFLDAHWPYPAPDSYATRYASAEAVEPFRGSNSKALRDDLNHGEIEMTAEHRRALEALYDGSLRYIDDQLRAFHEALVLRGMADNTILCVVADHGEEFGEHGRIGHGYGLWENLLSVPWILYVPGQEAKVVENPVSLVDVFPTLLAAASIPLPSRVEGVNRLEDPKAPRPVFAEHKGQGFYKQSLREGATKFVRTFHGPEREVGTTLPFDVGQRWEIEVELDDNGQLFAVEMKPDSDDVEDPIEVKGMVAEPAENRFFLGGIEVRHDGKTKLQLTDEARDMELFEGRVVKVRGETAEGFMAAERIRFYARGDAHAVEIRGPIFKIEEEDGAGRFQVGGFWIGFSHQTDVEGGSTDSRGKEKVLERAEIVSLLEGGEEALASLGVSKELTAYDLERDPDEQRGMDDPNEAMNRLLDALGSSLVRTRVFEESDRLLLTPEAVQSLRAIGYAE